MNINELLLEALNLMLVGMLFVSVFLGILVVLIPLLNKISPDDSLPEPPKPQAAVAATGLSPQTVAAIAAAVGQYRRDH